LYELYEVDRKMMVLGRHSRRAATLRKPDRGIFSPHPDRITSPKGKTLLFTVFDSRKRRSNGGLIAAINHDGRSSVSALTARSTRHEVFVANWDVTIVEP
jgi:hypothetical protein